MHQRSVTLGLFVSAIVGGIVGKITTPGSFGTDPEVINNKSRTILALVSELTGENGTSTEIANNTRTHQLLFELQKEASDLISVPNLDPDLVTWLDVLLQALDEIFNALDIYIEENLRTSLGNLARHLKGAKIYLGREKTFTVTTYPQSDRDEWLLLEDQCPAYSDNCSVSVGCNS